MSDSSTPSFCTTRRVEFRDTDAAGIVHFSAFFPMMEAAEHEFLRSRGLSVMQPQDDGGHLTWPRVSATCDYHAAARFEDQLTIAVWVDHVGGKSVRYRFEFSCNDQRIATGQLTAVCCQLTNGHLQSVTIPNTVRAKLAGE